MYPRINCGLFAKKILRDPEEDIDIKTEGVEFETMCVIHNMGIVELKYFDYKYTNKNYSIDITTSRFLSFEQFDCNVPILNSLLTLGGDCPIDGL